MIVAFHNGWKLINKKGINNFVKLDDLSGEDFDVKLQFEGEIELDNVLFGNKMEGVIIL
jgi:hypothetical protein